MAGAAIPTRVARWTGTFPDVINVVLDTTNGANVIPGSLVVTDTDGEVIIFGGGTDAVVLGVSLGTFQNAAGYGMPNNPSQVTNRANTVPVAVANTDTVFEMSIVSSGSTYADPALADIGDEYGVVLNSGIWAVDKAEASTKIVHIVDIDTDRKTVFVKFLSAVCETLA